MQPEPESNKTFRELLATFNDGDVINQANVLRDCLYENTEDKPSTKDILDAVKKIGTEAGKKRGELSSPSAFAISRTMTDLITAYLENKKITPEQSFNPFEALRNPLEAINGLLRDTERSFLGLSQESKFVTDVINEIIRPLDNTLEINMTKKGILKAYFENNNVHYDEFKNLLKINKIDDPQSQVEMLVSFLKRSNLDESKFVENVNDFSRENSLTQENKGKILEGYLVGKNSEVKRVDVENLGRKIELIFIPELEISSRPRAKDDKIKDDIQDVVDAVNSKIRPKAEVYITEKATNDASYANRPSTDVAAVSSTKTFKELLATFNDDDVLMKARVLTNCLYDNTGDKPSTKDILDAVKKIGTEAEKKRGELSSPGASAISNAMTNLITAYLENKQIIPEQSFNPFEALLNPIEAANSFLKDTERSFLGLSQESKFVTNVINEIILPLKDNTWEINMAKTRILKAYFENNNVSYDEFKNLLKINNIDDPQSKVEMLVSFLKKSNLDESIIVKNVNDFSHENSLTQENKGKILEGYLVGKNREVTKEEVSGLAEKIKLKIYSQQIFDEASMHKANFQTAKNTQISQQSQTISDDLAKFKYSREDAKLSRSIEEVVKAVNSKIRPRTDVAAAVLSTPEATAKVSNDASAGR